MKTLTTLALCAASIAAIDLGDPAFTFSATFDAATSEIVILTTQPDNSWLGILLGSSSMTDTEVIYFVADADQSYVKNGWSSGEVAPDVTTPTQTVTRTITSFTSTVSMTTRRKINTGESGKFVFPLDNAIDMGYAHKTGSIQIS